MVNNMSKVDSAKQAVEIANEFLKSTGVPVHLITKTEPKGDKWIVEARSIGIKFTLKIDKNTGEVTDYTSTES